MKTIRLLPVLCLIVLPLLACAPADEWATHAVEDTGFPPYTFEYPAGWALEAGNNFTSLVSQKKLFNDPPEKMEPGQVIVGLTLNIKCRPMIWCNTASTACKASSPSKKSPRWN